MNPLRLLFTTFLCVSFMSNAKVAEVKGLDQLNSNVLQSGKPAIIKVSASWCGACTRAKQPYESLASDSANSDVIFAEVDADASPDIVKNYNVQSLPTFIFVKNGQEVKRTTGFSDNFKKEFSTEIANLRGGAAAPAMEKKTEEITQPAAADQVQAAKQEESRAVATSEPAPESGTCAANPPDNFLEKVVTGIRDFFTSIVDTVRGWFK